MWEVPRIWNEVWIIGGGPSITEQFDIPKQIVQKVINGGSISEYSDYMNAIHEKHIIGINVAFMLGDWIDWVFFGDTGFYLKYARMLAGFSGLKISCSPKTKSVNWIKYLERSSGAFGISDKPYKVCWNGNSGAAAISVAVHAGAKRIVLLGFDMNLGENNIQHFHGMYRGGARPPSPKRIRGVERVILPFNRHLKGFPAIARDAKRLGVEILNASPRSRIDVFRKVSVKEILNG
jgi:hypothetical protein